MSDKQNQDLKKDVLETKLQDLIRQKSDENQALRKLLDALENSRNSEENNDKKK